MNILELATTKRNEFIDITVRVEKTVQKQKVDKGVVIIFCPHTTAGLTINENADQCVQNDISSYLAKLIPKSEDYSHLEGNSDSHIKASIFGSSLKVIIEGGRLVLGTWQGIYFCEFDGPRNRKVYIKTLEG